MDDLVAGTVTERDAVEAAARALAAARRVVVATGAGMSQESGIPTFRDAVSGMWSRFDPDDLATPAAFARDPARVFGWYAWRRRLMRAAEPHTGYDALVALEALVPDVVVVTQNIDGLHRRAGSRRVVELHGSLDRFVCAGALHPYPAEAVPESAADGAVAPPVCPQCGALVRPAVVWFGEMLPETAVRAAWEAAARCDVMLVIGTSGLVYPAAALPQIAGDAGATVVEVNPEADEGSWPALIRCRGRAGVVLPALVERLRRHR